MKKKVWYLGTDPSQFVCQEELLHYPVIKIIPRSVKDSRLKRAYDDLDLYTHLIFTSKNAVSVFFDHLQTIGYDISQFLDKQILAVGKVTASYLNAGGLNVTHVAQEEMQEGIIAVLNQLFLENAYILLPRSSLSRPLLEGYLMERSIRFQIADLYDTEAFHAEPPCPLEEVDEIVFTSPSTVHAFIKIFGALPGDKQLTPLGKITEAALRKSRYVSV